MKPYAAVAPRFFAGFLLLATGISQAATLNPPSNAAATPFSETRIDVSWQDLSADETGFEIRRSTTGPNGTFRLLASTGAQITRYSDTGLSASLQYCYSVRAFKKSGSNTSYSPSATIACATTLAPPLPQAPNAPSDTRDVSVSYDRIDINWQDNSNNESGFQIYRADRADGNFALVGTSSAGTTVRTDTGLSPSTLYCHKIRAFATLGAATSFSDFSNVSCATTLAPPPPPPAPGLRLATSTTGVDLDTDGYRVDVWKRSYDGWSLLYVTNANVPSNGAMSFSDLESGREYVLEFSGIAVNCDPTDANPRSVTLGATGAIFNFNVTCAAAKKLAFASSAEGSPAIYVINANGAEGVPLTLPSDWASEPAWSPDGSKIAFRGERDATAQIYVMSADGSNQVRLTSTLGGNFRPAWSPDGTRIAFTSYRDGNREIYVMNNDGSGVVNLTDHLADDADPAWSPDGTRIAFRSNRDGDPAYPGIYLMNADGSSITRLTNEPWVSDSQPSWSPDSTRLAISRVACTAGWCSQKIYLVNVADGWSAGAETGLMDPDSQYHSDPVWYPDGRKLTFTSAIYGSSESSVSFVRLGGPPNAMIGERITGGFNPNWRR